MSTQTHTCLTIHCDECGKPLESDYIIHVASIEDAQLWADDEGWRFVGGEHICAFCVDKPHAFTPEATDALTCERCDLEEDDHLPVTTTAVAS